MKNAKTDQFSIVAHPVGEVTEVEIAYSLVQQKSKAPRAILTVEVLAGDKSLLEVELGLMAPSDPRYSFTIRGAKPGDKLIAKFTDSERQEHLAETTVQVQSGK